MEQLGAADYAAAQPLFRSLDYHLAVRTILDGTIPAPIYADDPAHPQAALIRHKSRLYLAGSTQNEAFNQAVRRFVVECIAAQARAAGAGALVLYYASPDWEAVIERLLSDTFRQKTQRQFYTFDVLRN